MNNLFLMINEAADGPFTVDQVQSMLASGAITKSTLWCNEGAEEWKTVGELPERPRPRILPVPRSGMEHEIYEADRYEQTEGFKLARSASTIGQLGIGCFVMVPILVLVCIAKLQNGDWMLWAAVAGGLVTLGMFLVIVSQLMHIRAALPATKN